MPYRSRAQQAYFHANVGKKGITPAVVSEFDQATKGKFKSLPERVKPKVAKKKPIRKR